MYLGLDEIATIQLDHTSRCNLLCPQCARTEDGLQNSKLPIGDLTIDDYARIFDPFIGSNVKIFHCGNYGDVIASPTFDETLDWCITKGFKRFNIHTNGSARKPEWWRELAQKIGQSSSVTFSVDGLADTNHIYRVNSKFDKILENMRAFLDAGGVGIWSYIVFSHNEHQIAQAELLAKELGMREFIVKQTSRFITTREGFMESVKSKHSNVTVNDKNDNVTTWKQIVNEYGDFDSYTKKTRIACKYKQTKTIYVDFEMKVWPCCWTGAPTYFFYENAQTDDLKRIYERYGSDFNSLRLHDWYTILSHPWLQRDLMQSWEDEGTRLYVCGRTCGEKFKFTPDKDIKRLDQA